MCSFTFRNFDASHFRSLCVCLIWRIRLWYYKDCDIIYLLFSCCSYNSYTAKLPLALTANHKRTAIGAELLEGKVAAHIDQEFPFSFCTEWDRSPYLQGRRDWNSGYSAMYIHQNAWSQAADSLPSNCEHLPASSWSHQVASQAIPAANHWGHASSMSEGLDWYQWIFCRQGASASFGASEESWCMWLFSKILLQHTMDRNEYILCANQAHIVDGSWSAPDGGASFTGGRSGASLCQSKVKQNLPQCLMMQMILFSQPWCHPLALLQFPQVQRMQYPR